jgi:hypothetical protein
MYTEKIAVYSEFPTKYIYSLCGQNAEFLYVKPGGICSKNWSLIRTQQDKSRVHKSQGTTLCTVKPDIFSRLIGVFTLTYKNVSQYTRTGQKETDTSEVHRSLQNCGFSMWRLLLSTLLAPRI